MIQEPHFFGLQQYKLIESVKISKVLKRNIIKTFENKI